MRYTDAEQFEKRLLELFMEPRYMHDEDNYYTAMSIAIDEIRHAPTADVVPKSEVDEIVRQWKEEANCWQNNYITELRANEQIKAEVAREIFEEIATEISKKLPLKIYCGIDGKPFKGNEMDVGRERALYEVLGFVIELKKKYTENLNG